MTYPLILGSQDKTLVAEGLSLLLERIGHQVIFMETHKPNLEDESPYAQTYDDDLAAARLKMHHIEELQRDFGVYESAKFKPEPIPPQENPGLLADDGDFDD